MPIRIVDIQIRIRMKIDFMIEEILIEKITVGSVENNDSELYGHVA